MCSKSKKYTDIMRFIKTQKYIFWLVTTLTIGISMTFT